MQPFQLKVHLFIESCFYKKSVPLKTYVKLLGLLCIIATAFLLNSCKKQNASACNATVKRATCGCYIYLLDNPGEGLFADSASAKNNYRVTLYDGERVKVDYANIACCDECDCATLACGNFKMMTTLYSIKNVVVCK